MKNQPLMVVFIIFWLTVPASANTHDNTPNDRDGDEEGACIVERDKDYLHLINNTSYAVEDMIRWACDYLQLENITICVSPQPRYFGEAGFVLKEGKIYYIYLKKNITNLNLILIHELIHVKQYETKELVALKGGVVSFRGTKINLQRTKYANRAYEVDAHAQDSKILQEYYRQRRSLMAKSR